jgi:hypothetical protein
MAASLNVGCGSKAEVAHRGGMSVLLSRADFATARCEVSNPRSRDSGSGAYAPSRNDDGEARKSAKSPVAPKIEFPEPNQADATCPAVAAKINRFAIHPNHLHKPRRPAPLNRGAFRDRHGRWVRDAVDAFGAKDERIFESGRRSRVVLTPRRWRQLGDEASVSRRGWWQQSPVTRESAKETVKTIRVRECRVIRRVPAVTNSRVFYLSTRGCGCACHPAFPTPSSGEGSINDPGVTRRGDAGVWLHSARHSGARVSASYGAQLRT